MGMMDMTCISEQKINDYYFMNMLKDLVASKAPLTNDEGHQACLLLLSVANRKTTK